MLLDPGFLFEHLETIIFLVVVIGIGKALILAAISRAFGYKDIVPIAVGLGLFQIGEFSFVLGRVGVETNSIDNDIFSVVLTAGVVTMVLTPFVSGQTARLYRLKNRWFQHESLELVNVPSDGLRDHAVIAGGGRVGFLIGRTLQQLGLPFVLIELDAPRFEQAKRAGMPTIYGDASHEIVLRSAGTSEARLLLVTTPALVVARAIVLQAKRLNASIDTVARSSEAAFIPLFKELDVGDIVLPEFEAGLEMTRQALVHLKIPAPEIQRLTESLRQELFDTQGSPDDYKILGHLRSAERQFDLQWVTVPPTSSLVARSIGEAAIRKTTDASVVGVIRDGELVPNPGADFRFQAGDLAAIIGTDTARQAFEKL
jgi:CPA2 family monovalent cation:H+ antiporter-2